jgi:hypothetical protein
MKAAKMKIVSAKTQLVEKRMAPLAISRKPAAAAGAWRSAAVTSKTQAWRKRKHQQQSE